MAATIDGNGLITLDGTSTTQGRVRLAEDTDNGTNYVELSAPASVASNVTFTLPSADGTNGQVLQTNGSGALSFATPSGGGSWVYLSTVTATGAATADIETTFDSTYDMYAIVATNISVATNNVALVCRMKIGGSYLTTSSYRNVYGSTKDTDVSIPFNGSNGTSSSIQMTPALSNAANTTTSFTAYIPAPSNTAIYKAIYADGVYTAAGPVVGILQAAGYNTGTSALTGVRFYAGSGNISGTFRLYGIKNS